MKAAHIVGAGLAGLSAAVRLAAAGVNVTIHEATGHAGGRARSYDDPVLGRRIDNGNHLVLSGNRDVFDYLALIGAKDGLVGPARAQLEFLDLPSGARWTVAPGRGPVPWWILSKRKRVPDTRLAEYLHAFRLFGAGKATVAELLARPGLLWPRFWEPLAVAVLNTTPEEAAASLLIPVLKETFGRGEPACRPRVARRGLSEAFVDPAVAWLQHRGADVQFRHRVRGLDATGRVVRILRFGDGEDVRISADEAVVLAVPPRAAARLVPGLAVPNGHRPIVNAHFLLPEPVAEPLILGLIGGYSQWLFRRGDVASVTVSAACKSVADDDETISTRIWPEIRQAIPNLPINRPPARIVRERLATFAQTPANLALRPNPRTEWDNFVLAGDWTATGLPATIEGSIRSGRRAANILLNA